jgi:hypothetical protein
MAGLWDVNVIKNGLSAKGFLGWEAYWGLDPRGEERADHRAALIAGMVFNMAVDPKNRKPYTEWLLKFKDREPEKPGPTKEQIAQKQFELLSIYARAFSGTDIVEDTSADRLAQKRLQEQVAQAHAAMKET